LERPIRRGDVYWIDFDLPIGKRPAVIVQNDIGNRFSATVIVAVITSALPGKSYPTDVLLPNGTLPKKNSRVLAGTIITIEKEDLKDYQVTLPEDIMARVDSALMASLDLEKYKPA